MRHAFIRATIVAVTCLAFAEGLHAQDPIPSRMPILDRVEAAPRDSALPPLMVDGRRLRPRGSLYDVLVTTDSGTQHVGWHTVWVYDAMFSGRAAWEVFERRESHAPFVVRVTRDSSVLNRDTLHPLRWEGVAGDARMVAAFANDSVYGGTTSTQARATFTIAAPGHSLTSEGTLDVVLQAAPLADGWRATTPLVIADLSGARTVAVTLQVERTEQVAVPAGSFDAWVVRVAAPGTERLVWVDRSTQLVVKTVETPPHMPGARVERVFVGGY